MLYAMFVFADRFYRTRLFTWHGDIHNGMIRTTLMANTATDASVMVNHRLTVLFKAYSVFGAVHIATAGYASATKIGNLIVDLDTGRTCFVNHTHDIFLIRLGAAQCHTRIIRKGSDFIMFIRHIQSHQRKSLISPYRPFFMYAATSHRLRSSGTQFYGEPVYLFY